MTQRPHPTTRLRGKMCAAASAIALGVGLTAATWTPVAATPSPAIAPDTDLAAALEAAPTPLTTPFEDSDGATWTTVAQGQRFWRDLDAASDRVRVTRTGGSTQGRPLQLVQVGAPAPRSQAEAAQGSVILFTCSVHGDEPSGREACMKLARDLAFTTDPRLLRLLRSSTVLFVNANPDGWQANTRTNADGVDVNRDYLALETPEARNVAKVIRDWKPDIVNDLHEYGPRTDYNTDLLQLWPRNRNVDSVLHGMSKTMSDEYAADQVAAAGLTTGVYGHLVRDGVPYRQIAGDGQARILRNYVGLRNSVGMLSESANAPLNPEEEADQALTNNRRVTVNYLSAVGSLEYLSENRESLVRETAGAEQRATQRGADRSGIIYFGGQDDMLPTSADEVEANPPCGYRLTREQRLELAPTLRLHGVTWTNGGGSSFVTLAQPGQGLIPLLLDERSEYRIATAEVVREC